MAELTKASNVLNANVAMEMDDELRMVLLNNGNSTVTNNVSEKENNSEVTALLFLIEKKNILQKVFSKRYACN